MKKYRVVLREVWEQTWEVEADSKQEAYEKACNGDGRDTDFEYSRTLNGEADNDVTEVKEED